MKAMVLTAPGDLTFADVERPKPAPGQVLVRVTHAGTCGTDLKIYEGGIPVRHPLIMGHEMAGEVVEAGVARGDYQIRQGDRVVVDPCLFCGVCYCCRAGKTSLCPHGGLIGRDADGGFAEYLTAPASHVFPLPEAIHSRNAPLIQVVTTCLHAQRRLNIFPGQSVAVVGLGVTGQVHVQLAKAWGAHPVIGISRGERRRRLAEELGADITLPGGDEGVRGVLDATDGRGANVVIESTGMVPAMASAVSMARLGATLLLFGITTTTESGLPFYQLYFKELTIVTGRAAKGEDFPAAIDLIVRGAVKLEPLVTQLVSLSELGAAIGMLKSDDGHRMKIILET